MRFRVTRATDTVEIAFDDGGMNLLSSEALRELRAVVGSQLSVVCDSRTTENRPTTAVFRSGQARLFAAGADMAEMERFSAMDAYAFARLGQEVFEAIERMPCLTIARIDGDCFGGALDLVLAFDLRYATPRSRFAHPGARIGIVTGFGGTSRWRKVLTRPAANQLFLANRTLSAEEALRLGIIDGIGEPLSSRASSEGPGCVGHDDHACRPGHPAPSLDARDDRRCGAADMRLVKELTKRADRLSRAELLLLAQRHASLR